MKRFQAISVGGVEERRPARRTGFAVPMALATISEMTPM